MRKALAVLALVSVLTGAAAAQPTVDVAVGMVPASSPLYGLDVAADNAAVQFNLVSPGAVAHERASEALRAARNGNEAARQQALDEMNRVAQVASSNDTTGLAKAEAVLTTLKEELPSQAQGGISTALNNVRTAQDRAPEDAQRMIPDTPASGSAGNPGPAA